MIFSHGFPAVFHRFLDDSSEARLFRMAMRDRDSAVATMEAMSSAEGWIPRFRDEAERSRFVASGSGFFELQELDAMALTCRVRNLGEDWNDMRGDELEWGSVSFSGARFMALVGLLPSPAVRRRFSSHELMELECLASAFPSSLAAGKRS
jgi:hypothetical protein